MDVYYELGTSLLTHGYPEKQHRSGTQVRHLSRHIPNYKVLRYIYILSTFNITLCPFQGIVTESKLPDFIQPVMFFFKNVKLVADL